MKAVSRAIATEYFISTRRKMEREEISLIRCGPGFKFLPCHLLACTSHMMYLSVLFLIYYFLVWGKHYTYFLVWGEREAKLESVYKSPSRVFGNTRWFFPSEMFHGASSILAWAGDPRPAQ